MYLLQLDTFSSSEYSAWIVLDGLFEQVKCQEFQEQFYLLFTATTSPVAEDVQVRENPCTMF